MSQDTNKGQSLNMKVKHTSNPIQKKMCLSRVQHYIPNKEDADSIFETVSDLGVRILKPFKPIKGGYRKVY